MFFKTAGPGWAPFHALGRCPSGCLRPSGAPFRPTGRSARCIPFVEATADQLPHRLSSVARKVSLTGLQNDWIHQAVAVASKGPDAATVTLSLQGPPEVRRHVRLRVVGFVQAG